ncbi:MAG: arginine N-succinyltransferase [Planctomycetota bacterium]
MNLVRLAQPQDLDALVGLARQTSYGLTTLTPDADRLSQRLIASASGEAPLLVMVEPDQGRIVGTAGLMSRVGDAQRAEPFYAYRLERSVHRSKSLNVHHEVDALHLVKDFNGPTEIGTLFLHPDHRGGGNGRVLSLSRFLLIANQPTRFDRQVIAELRGVIDEHGRSPFWDGLGRHFFRVDYPVADDLSARDKRFIAELMPTHPIYVPLLSAEAQRVIGQVHPNTAPARRLLEDEGFHFANMVDIFDAGPCLRCDRAAIRTIRESSVISVLGYDDSSESTDRIRTLVASANGPFRMTAIATTPSPEGLCLPRDVAEQLEVQPGDDVRVAPVRAISPTTIHPKPAIPETAS